MKTLRYLHLFIGAAALLAGLFASMPFLTQSAPINYPGLLAILTALVNLQQFTQQRTADSGFAGATALLGSALLIIAACIPFSALLVNPLFADWSIWALSAAISGTCLHTLSALGQELSAMQRSPRAAKPTKPAKKAATNSNDPRETGTVKWFNTSKGFGFITRDDGGDVFVHFRSIQGEGHRALQEGQRVSYVVANRDKGLQAEDVAILNNRKR
ncbi:MAG: cold-shock protein [Pseudomonadaceae bacterium]